MQTGRKTLKGEEPQPLYTAIFTFAKGVYDAEFHQLDAAIAQAAKALPGYLGEEAWENPETGLISNVYYWDSLEALHRLMEHPVHRHAKAAQARWLRGFHVVIAQVLASYGDGGATHPLNGVPVSGLRDRRCLAHHLAAKAPVGN